MSEQKPEKKILEPSAYSDPIHGEAYRKNLAAQWALQDLDGGLAGLIVRGDSENGSAVMPNTYPPKVRGNNTKCSICGEMFGGSGRWAECANCRD